MFTFSLMTQRSDFSFFETILRNDSAAQKWIAYWADTDRWFEQITSQKFAVQVILNGEIVGFVDFELDSRNYATFTYYVLPEHRGKGIASISVQEAISWLKMNYSVSVIFAYVDKNNLSSLKAVDKANFKYEMTRNNMMYFTKIV